MQDQIKVDFQEAVHLFNQKKFKKSFLKLIPLSNKLSKDESFLSLLSSVQQQLQDFSARQKTLKVLCEIAKTAQNQLMYMSQLLDNNLYNAALDVGLVMQDQMMTLEEKNQLFGMMSKIYIHENDFEGLSEIVKRYEQENILSEHYHYSKSLLNLNQSNEMTALESLRQAVVQNQNFDQGWVALALLHDKMGDQDLSMANLEKALDVNPLNASALKHFSKKSILNGSVDKAVEKINFYLQVHNFDQEMTVQYAGLMKLKNMNDIVQRESDKLTYYFGHQISL
jgi:tetratricopeptide (TPR) repeat protein